MPCSLHGSKVKCRAMHHSTYHAVQLRSAMQNMQVTNHPPDQGHYRLQHSPRCRWAQGVISGPGKPPSRTPPHVNVVMVCQENCLDVPGLCWCPMKCKLCMQTPLAQVPRGKLCTATPCAYELRHMLHVHDRLWRPLQLAAVAAARHHV
jgi:hypothetical protein